MKNYYYNLMNKPKMNLDNKQKLGLILMGVLLLIFLVTYLLFFSNNPEYVLPLEMNSQDQTYEEIMDFINYDDTDQIPYGLGFNCVDATFRLWRNAAWNGYASYLIVIVYDQNPNHMVIVFPTSDKGDLFIEPQSDSRIKLRVGQDYNGRTIKGIYVLDYNFIPLYGSSDYDSDIISE